MEIKVENREYFEKKKQNFVKNHKKKGGSIYKTFLIRKGLCVLFSCGKNPDGEKTKCLETQDKGQNPMNMAGGGDRIRKNPL